MSRETVRLETLAAEGRYSLVGGPFGSKLTSADYVEDGIPVIRGSNLNGGRYLEETDFVFVSEQKMHEDLFANLAYPGDIIFTQRGTLGQVAIIPNDARFGIYIISQSQMKLTVDHDKADPRFIYYYFSSREAIQKILSQNSSSGVPHINLTSLRNFSVPKVPRPRQTEIADILSAYDDLIDNNRRRIALLEEVARLLYREWFVHFRFPGHEHIKIIDGLPEGWERGMLGDLLTLKRGYDLPQQRRVHGDIPIVSSSGITGYHSEKKADGPGIVTGRYGTIGEVYLIEQDFWPLNTALYVSDKKGNPPIYLSSLLRQALSQIQSEKAAVPGLNRNALHTIRVSIPPARFRQHFEDAVEPMLSQRKILETYNRTLARARDLLLPRLMNGEISV